MSKWYSKGCIVFVDNNDAFTTNSEEISDQIVIDHNCKRMTETNTSVIRWTQYDGTVGTLPLETEEVILYTKIGDMKACFTGRLGYEFEEMKIGDVWAYRPEPDNLYES